MRKTAGLSRQKEVFSSHPVTFPQGSAWAPKSSGLRLSPETWPRSPPRPPLLQTESKAVAFAGPGCDQACSLGRAPVSGRRRVLAHPVL